MTQPPSPETDTDLIIRSYRIEDQPAVSRLYTDGLLSGQIAPNDTGADVDNVLEAYFDHDRHHFWVCELEGGVVGMIGVGSDERDTAEIRRLRVEPRLQDTDIAQQLAETAVGHCKKHGFLKVRLDTRYKGDAVFELFSRLGFKHNRTKTLNEKDLHEFYLDLYGE
ncbi:GNAT family N-acetyltransferase [Mucisphaera calidilacus]|uniref:GNAT family N-acetyltransferase n=1 Tax=Mucisphaera calidilacus TaxID=2527982 RepID=UPI001F1DD3ED|nr:GNAT family N-acetyltransferase [Mucisphaera calidilacus]